MKKKIIKIIQIFIIFIASFSAFLLAEDIPQKSEDACIWKIESDSNIVYLMGSIHCLKDTDYPLNEKFNQCFYDAENLVLELNPDSMQAPAFQQYALTKAFYSNGETFQSSVSDSTYTLVKNKLLELGMPIEKFNTFRPWFIAITMLNMNAQKLGLDPKLGIDQRFFTMAKETPKNIIALETPEYQINLFAMLSDEDQESFIHQTIDQAGEMESGFNDLIDAWKAGNLEKINENLNKGFEEYPPLKQSFFVQRNHNWLEKIIEFTKDNEDYLVIVGAGHLAGDEGLVNLLKNKGYDVEQVRTTKDKK